MRRTPPTVQVLLVVSSVWALCACGSATAASSDVRGGDPHRGQELFEEVGCGSCHRMEQADRATGTVGPPLDDFRERIYIAGTLDNTPGNLVRWLRSPQSIRPGTAMPDLDLDEQQARHIAAFLRARR